MYCPATGPVPGLRRRIGVHDRRSRDARRPANRRRTVRDAAGGSEYVGEFASGDVSWSNELVAHVVELKTTEPAKSLRAACGCIPGASPADQRIARPARRPAHARRHAPVDGPGSRNEALAARFERDLRELPSHLRLRGAWLVELAERPPEFALRRRRGVRPAARRDPRFAADLAGAIAASSPIVDGRVTGVLDERLDAYRENSRRIPSITGHVVPEAVFTEADYRDSILARLYSDIAPHDPQAILQHEWLNARGAVARFERNTIEVPPPGRSGMPGRGRGDLRPGDGRFAGACRGAILGHRRAAGVARRAIGHGAGRRDSRRGSARSSTTRSSSACSACTASSSLADLWRHIHDAVADRPGRTAAMDRALAVILDEGPLARRILRAVNGHGAQPLGATRRLLAALRLPRQSAPRCTCRSCTPGMTAVHCDRAMAFAWQAEDCLTYDWPSTS